MIRQKKRVGGRIFKFPPRHPMNFKHIALPDLISETIQTLDIELKAGSLLPSSISLEGWPEEELRALTKLVQYQDLSPDRPAQAVITETDRLKLMAYKFNRHTLQVEGGYFSSLVLSGVFKETYNGRSLDRGPMVKKVSGPQLIAAPGLSLSGTGFLVAIVCKPT